MTDGEYTRIVALADQLTDPQRQALELLYDDRGVFAHWRAVRSLIAMDLAIDGLPPRISTLGESVWREASNR